MVVDFSKLGLKSFVRMKRTCKVAEIVKKILNGGGSLSNGLIEDAIKCFPGAKILSAYGVPLFALCSFLYFYYLIPLNLSDDAT